MYVHPQEIDYNIDTLFELIDASGLEFVGFSNPKVWQIDRLLGKAPALMQRVEGLSDRQRYRLIELLDPATITHYEFFLGRAPFTQTDWSSDVALLRAIPERSTCMDGWDSHCLFNCDYQIINLTEPEWQFLKAADGNQLRSTQEILAAIDLGVDLGVVGVRSLLEKQLILLTPKG